MARLKDKVDFIVTDSPLLLSIIYNDLNTEDNHIYSGHFDDTVVEIFNRYENFNIHLIRNKERYQTEGRTQSQEEAEMVDYMIANILNKKRTFSKTYFMKNHTSETLSYLVDECIGKWGKINNENIVIANHVSLNW